LSDHPVLGRKLLHIFVGNIAFLLPVFQTREVMAFIAAGPFVLFTFLMSPSSPIKRFRGKTSAVGHGMGLVYYALTWTVLAYLFFDTQVVIAIAIFAMSYGDGLASVIGLRYGRRKYQVWGDQKSYAGSGAMFLFTLLMIFVALVYYHVSLSLPLVVLIVLITLVSTVVEGVTPKGLDNLTVPFVIVLLYWLFVM
jgi:dolichol kinase